jgi:iron-sulfur cluster insertion protein
LTENCKGEFCKNFDKFKFMQHTITLTKQAIERLHQVKEKENNKNKFLRVSISGGGCSGFKYLFELDDKKTNSDLEIYSENSEIFAVTDDMSIAMLNGCAVDFISEIGASYFKIINPNAIATCGCGSSFAV